MTIDSCPECNGKLSSEAEACPHCGFKTEKAKSKETTWKDVGMIAIVMAGFVGILGLVVWFFTHLSGKL